MDKFDKMSKQSKKISGAELIHKLRSLDQDDLKCVLEIASDLLRKLGPGKEAASC